MGLVPSSSEDARLSYQYHFTKWAAKNPELAKGYCPHGEAKHDVYMDAQGAWRHHPPCRDCHPNAAPEQFK